jgi:hypothetical protein
MPRSDYDDRLKDYVEVKERIRLFYEAHPEGRLTTTDVRITSEPDGTPRVWVAAAAYRTADDPVPGKGWSWMVLPGSTPYTKGSELENTETSAWGRAIGALGIGIDKGIASMQEVRSKSGEETRKHETTDDGGLVGKAEIGKGVSDFELRQTPDGMALSFRLVSGRGGIKVVARDPIAEPLALMRDAVIGQRVTCWGHITDETFRPKGSTKDVTYQVLALERIKAAEFELPAQNIEAESVPLFDDDEAAAIAAAVDAAGTAA